MDNRNKLRYAQKVAMFFIIIGALNWGCIGILNKNIVEKILGNKTIFSKIIYILIGVSALFLAFNRNTYLPFLGEAVFPSSVLKEQTPAGATTRLRIKIKPFTKIIYWASEPDDNINMKSFELAYDKYENAGVTTSNNEGIATINIRKPQSYSVPLQTLSPHVHYRIVNEFGFLGPVETYFFTKYI